MNDTADVGDTVKTTDSESDSGSTFCKLASEYSDGVLGTWSPSGALLAGAACTGAAFTSGECGTAGGGGCTGTSVVGLPIKSMCSLAALGPMPEARISARC
eukprot:838440-Prymnesium_polylepis.2